MSIMQRLDFPKELKRLVLEKYWIHPVLFQGLQTLILIVIRTKVLRLNRLKVCATGFPELRLNS